MRKDWVEIQLGDFLDFKGGGTPRKNRPEYWHGDIPWASIKDIKGMYLHKTGDNITVHGLENSSSNIAEPNQIILATRINPGRPIITKIRTSINQDLKIVIPKITIDRDFLYFLFTTLERKILKVSSGTTVLGINLNNLKEIRAAIPPLPEQRAIVAKIEQLFSELGNGIANLKMAQEQLKVYRQAVLQKAFEGNHPLVRLEEISEVNTGATPKRGKKSYWENGNIPWVTSGALNHLFVDKETEFITETALEETNCKIFPAGSLLIAMYGEGKTRGKCSELRINAATNQAVAAITLLESNESSKEFIKWFLLKNYEEIRLLSSGGVQPNINLSIIKKTEIPFPSFKKQHQIVQEIESRLSVCDKLQETLSESLEKAEALRQSLLKKAFAGELLTQQELENCKAEPDWEPAEQLLQRIKDDKNQAPKPQIAAKSKTVAKSMSTTDMHAGVITKIIQLHENNPEYFDKLSHVKCEKIAHLAEYYVGLDLGRVPKKDAAGPDDYPHLKKVESRAQKAGFFTKMHREIGYSYKTNRQANVLLQKVDALLNEEQAKKLEYLLRTFLKFDLEQSEIVATTYAGWNNLLLDGMDPTDEQIVYESRENWSKRKLGIPRERFFKAISWMREHDLVPQGTGLKVEKPIVKIRRRKA